MATILFIILLIEIFYRPRLDYTREKRLVLWFGSENRRYIFLT